MSLIFTSVGISETILRQFFLVLTFVMDKLYISLKLSPIICGCSCFSVKIACHPSGNSAVLLPEPKMAPVPRVSWLVEQRDKCAAMYVSGSPHGSYENCSVRYSPNSSLYWSSELVY